jgi:hypothetical protein
VRAPEPLHATRFVAAAATLDALPWPDDAVALRLAADDLLVIHRGSVMVASRDEPIIQEQEAGFVGWWLSPEEMDHVVAHVDWPLPTDRPSLAQGLIAGVPAKLWLAEDRALLLCPAAYAHELMERLP